MGGGGFLGGLTEMVTGGLIESKETKTMQKRAEAEVAEQKAEIEKRKREEEAKLDERRRRIARSKQGRRALLYSGEEGVQTTETLGG